MEIVKERDDSDCKYNLFMNYKFTFFGGKAYYENRVWKAA